jgi:aconitate hydratase
MGVLPLQFINDENAEKLGLDGSETFDIVGIEELNNGKIPQNVALTATGKSGTKTFKAKVRIDTPGEADYFRHGGILPYVLRQLAAS